MKIKLGTPKNPGRIQFLHSGYWYIKNGEKTWIPYKKSKASSFPIKKWYGIIVRGIFIGVIITSYEKSR